jgi:hypothetical protein
LTKINDTLTNPGYSVGVISINSTLFAAGEPVLPGVLTNKFNPPHFYMEVCLVPLIMGKAGYGLLVPVFQIL